MHFPVSKKSAKLVEESIEKPIFSTSAIAVTQKDPLQLLCYQKQIFMILASLG